MDCTHDRLECTNDVLRCMVCGAVLPLEYLARRNKPPGVHAGDAGAGASRRAHAVDAGDQEIAPTEDAGAPRRAPTGDAGAVAAPVKRSGRKAGRK